MCCLRRQRPYVTAIDESDQKMAQSPINKINNVMRLPASADHPSAPLPTLPLPAKNFQSRVHVHQRRAPNAVCFARNDYDWPRSRRFAGSDHYGCLCRGAKVVIWLSPIACLCAPSVTLSISSVPLTPLMCVCTLMLHTFALREFTRAGSWIFITNNVCKTILLSLTTNTRR